jgi:DNA-binding response OmpR family regulator
MITILIIEDESYLRRSLAELLTFEGFATLEAENGRQGVQVARSHLPDLILSDLMMPELDGFGVLRELRSEPDTASIPLLLITAISDKRSMQNGMDLGANAYLTKPFLHSELLLAINRLLHR